MSPPRGPRSVLCVVVVTTWACGKGEGCTPAGHQTGDVRDVGEKQAPWRSAIARKRAKSMSPRIGAVAAEDHLRLVLRGEPSMRS
jgi:hypothetical protein